tara:strand:- start:411 stop:1496 length:1086 start_codon:yes stop_codon:yes gene_type:complete
MSLDIYLPEHTIERFDQYLNSDEYKINEETVNAAYHWSKRTIDKTETFTITKKYIRINFGKDIGMGDQYINSFNLKDPNIKLNNSSHKKKRNSSDSGYYNLSFKRRILIFLLRKLGIYDGVSFDPIRNLKMKWDTHYDSNSNLLKPNDILKEYGHARDSSIIKSYYIYNSIMSVDSHFNFDHMKYIIEIGPGIGSLSRLIKSKYSNVNFLFIDLPTSIPFSFLNLIVRYPESTFCLPNEIKLTENFEGINFLFLANNQSVPKIDHKYDLAVNTMSFQEMNYKEIKKYFILIRKLLAKKNLFYCLNAVEKIMTTNQEVESIKFSEYPWSNNDIDYFYQLSEVESGRTKKPFFEKACQLEVNH